MKHRLMLLTAVIFWGWSFVATKICLEYLTPIEIIGLRMVLGTPLLLLILFVKKIKFNIPKKEIWFLFLASITLAIHFIIQVGGMIYTSATNTGWIISVTPAVIVLLSVIFLKEKIRFIQILGIFVATLGIFSLVTGGNLSSFNWLSNKGDWLILGSAHTWAIYTIQTKKITQKYSPLLVTTIILTFTSLTIIAYMTTTSDWSKFISLPPEPLWALLFLGVCCQGLAFWFWQEGVGNLGAVQSGFYLYLEPLATTMLAVPYLGEQFGVMTAIGGLLVLAGVYLTRTRKA